MSASFSGGGSDELMVADFPADWQNFSACGWARRTGDTNNYATLLYTERGGSYSYLGTNTSGTTLILDAGFGFGTFATSPATNEWFFWAFVSQGGGLNDTLGYWSSATDDVLWSETNTNNGPATGVPDSFQLSDGGFEWIGEIAAVKVWDAVLTSDELIAEKQCYTPHRLADLAAWWPLIDTGGATFADYSGNGNDFTENGTVTEGDGPPIRWSRRRSGIFVPAAVGDDAIDLVVADATHSHTADSPTITQTHELVAADCEHSHTADSPTVTQTHILVAEDATHSHTADQSTVTQSHEVAPDDTTHSHTADSPAITQTHILTVDEATHAHSADSPAITQTHIIAVDEATHAHSADNVTLTVSADLVAADATHSHTVDSPAITQTHVITVADCEHSHTADNVTITAGVGWFLLASDSDDSGTAPSIDSSGADFMVAVVSSTTSIGTVSDNKSNTWTQLTDNTSGTRHHAIFYCQNPTVGTGHVVSVSGGSFPSICVAAFSGAAIASVFDKESTADDDQPGSVTPTLDDSLIVSGACAESAFSQTIDSGFTIAEDVPYAAGTNIGSALAYLIQGSSAAVNPDWHDSTLMASIAVFKPLVSDVNLTVADATHSHTADSPTLTQTHVLSPNDATHSHTADSPAITQTHIIVASDCEHGHTADNVTVSVTDINLVSADAEHSHTVDSPTITQTHVLSPNDAEHSHTVDSPTLTQTHILVAADCEHGHTSDQPSITQTHIIVPADCEHSHTADNTTLTVGTQVDPNDAEHAHAADSPTLTQTHILTVDEATHSHTADSSVITQTHILVAADCEHSHTADNVTISIGDINLSSADCEHSHTAESPTVTQTHLLIVADATHSHTADSPTLTQTHVIVVADATHSHTADNVTITIGAISLMVSNTDLVGGWQESVALVGGWQESVALVGGWQGNTDLDGGVGG